MNFSEWDSSASSNMYSSHSNPAGMESPLVGGGASMNPQESAELQEFLAMEQEKARLRAQIQVVTDMCWDKCMGQPSSKLESKTENCLDNCTQRFFDVTVLVTQRFASLLQRQAGM